jgi:hypothetical protein
MKFFLGLISYNRYFNGTSRKKSLKLTEEEKIVLKSMFPKGKELTIKL